MIIEGEILLDHHNVYSKIFGKNFAKQARIFLK